jgi:transposase
MIDAELRARIRRLFFAEHWKVGTIAAELSVHHDTVRRAVETERFNAAQRALRASQLDPYRALLESTLTEHPRLRATRLYEMLRDRGYQGSVVQLRRLVRAIRPAARAEAFLRLRTLPGEQGQVDWGCFGKIRIGQAQRPLSCFVMVLSWSRALYARFSVDQTLESFLRGHVRAFDALGGVPRALLYDNLKSVVLERVGEHIRFHPRLLELAGHYHFAPRPCAPYRANEKGKVERAIQYLRHSFFAARRFSSLDDLNAQLTEWLARVAHGRSVPGDAERRLVRDALVQERERLLPLPAHPFECDLLKPVLSGKEPYVRFDLNDYSIPHTLVRTPLTLLASEERVRITDALGHVVADHPRSYGRGDVLEQPAHLAELGRQKRHARELRGRDRLRQACPRADEFLEALAVRGEPLARHVSALLASLERYGQGELNRAMEEVLAKGALSAFAVEHVLEQRARARKRPPPLTVSLPDDPRVRDLKVVPHALASYDALARTEEVDHDGSR